MSVCALGAIRLTVARNSEGTLIEDLKAAREELVKRGRNKGSYCFGEKLSLLREILFVPWSDLRTIEAVNALQSHIEIEDCSLVDFNEISTDEQMFDLWDKTLVDLGGMG